MPNYCKTWVLIPLPIQKYLQHVPAFQCFIHIFYLTNISNHGFFITYKKIFLINFLFLEILMNPTAENYLSIPILLYIAFWL
jgi:hypothetical protein